MINGGVSAAHAVSVGSKIIRRASEAVNDHRVDGIKATIDQLPR